MYNYFSDDIDWEAVNAEIQAMDWVELVRGLDHREKWKKFLDVLLEITKVHIPKRKACTCSGPKIPRERKVLLRRRRKIQKTLLAHNSEGKTRKLKKELLEIENKLLMSYKKSRRTQEEKAVASIHKNP